MTPLIIHKGFHLHPQPPILCMSLRKLFQLHILPFLKVLHRQMRTRRKTTLRSMRGTNGSTVSTSPIIIFPFSPFPNPKRVCRRRVVASSSHSFTHSLSRLFTSLRNSRYHMATVCFLILPFVVLLLLFLMPFVYAPYDSRGRMRPRASSSPLLSPLGCSADSCI